MPVAGRWSDGCPRPSEVGAIQWSVDSVLHGGVRARTPARLPARSFDFAQDRQRRCFPWAHGTAQLYGSLRGTTPRINPTRSPTVPVKSTTKAFPETSESNRPISRPETTPVLLNFRIFFTIVRGLRVFRRRQTDHQRCADHSRFSGIVFEHEADPHRNRESPFGHGFDTGSVAGGSRPQPSVDHF